MSTSETTPIIANYVPEQQPPVPSHPPPAPPTAAVAVGQPLKDQADVQASAAEANPSISNEKGSGVEERKKKRTNSFSFLIPAVVAIHLSYLFGYFGFSWVYAWSAIFLQHRS